MAHQTGVSAPLLRRINAETVLGVLRRSGPMTVTAIAGETGLSRPTVDATLNDLIQLGLTIGTTSKDGVSTGGRPARTFHFAHNAAHALGLDVRPTEIRAQLADLTGSAVAVERQSTDAAMPRVARLRALDTCIAAACKTARISPSSLAAIAVAAPGVVDASRGQVLFTTAIAEWSGLRLGELLNERYACPTFVDNDVNLAALAECWEGVAHGAENAIFFSLGERVGAGLLVGGELVRGQGGAGEVGFLDHWDEGRTTRGAVLQISAQLLGDLLGPRAARPQKTALRAPDDQRSLSWSTNVAALLTAARSGDLASIGALQRYLANAAFAMSTMTMLLSPELIIIGGDEHGGVLLLDQLRSALRELTSAWMNAPPRVEPAALGDQGALRGAIRQALDHVDANLLNRLGGTPPPRRPRNPKSSTHRH